MSLVACPRCEKLLTPEEVEERICSCGHALPIEATKRFEELDPEPPLVRLQWSAIGWCLAAGLTGAAISFGAALVLRSVPDDARGNFSLAVVVGVLCGVPCIALPFLFRRSPWVVATGLHLSYICVGLITLIASFAKRFLD